MFTHSTLARRGCAALVALALAGCSETQSVPPTSPVKPTAAHAAKTAAAPSPIVELAIPGNTLHLYPFVGSTFGAVQIEADPINIFFTGNAKPLGLRAALLALDGDRTSFGLPDQFPFNCTWSDASGDLQGAYVEPLGWIGNAIQLQCGDYVPMRFHLRLFDAGTVTIGGSPIVGVSLELGGASWATTTTGAGGSYSYTFSNLASGVYTVRPSWNGAAFTPTTATVTVSNVDVQQNFTRLASGILKRTAENSAAILELSKKSFELALSGLALEADAVLAEDPPGRVKVYFATDFDDPATAPPGAGPQPGPQHLVFKIGGNVPEPVGRFPEDLTHQPPQQSLARHSECKKDFVGDAGPQDGYLFRIGWRIEVHSGFFHSKTFSRRNCPLS